MSLANVNVKNRLNEVFSEYLQDNLSFSDLKNMLVSKTAVDFIHQKIKKEIESIERLEIEGIINVLETQAYETQKKDDEQESQNDLMHAQQDNSRLMSLQFATEPLRALRKAYGKELEALNTSSNTHEHTQTPVTHEHSSTPQKDPHVHEHGQSPQTNSNVHVHLTLAQKDPHVHEHQSAKLTPEELQRKINGVDEELFKIQKEISQIQIREGDRRVRESARNLRSAARVAYLSKTGYLKETLSNDKQQTLHYRMSKACQLSVEISNSLVRDASSINYTILLGQFELYLGRSKRSDLEIHALRKIYTQMQAHLGFESKARKANDDYLQAKERWERKSEELSKASSKLQDLAGANPALVLQNQKLEKDNEELQQKYNANIDQVNELIKPGLILGGLSLLFSVPLILTLAGVIPYFIEPVLLLSLFATPPALLLAAGIGVGIAALVYGVKAYFNNSSIQNNKNTVTNNVLQSARNTYEADQLRLVTIPQFEMQLPELKSQTQTHLKQKNLLDASVRDSLKTAQEIEPVSVTVVSVFSKPDSGIVHQHPSLDSTIPSAPPQDDTENKYSFH